MTSKDDEFLRKLQATFTVEAEEHVQAIAAGLLQLEKAPARDAQHTIVETTFRAAHSLKGAARAVDFRDVESSCQSLEDEFAVWKRQSSPPSADALDGAHRTLDRVIAALAGAPASPPNVPHSAPTVEKTFANDTVRIAVTKLEARLLKAEELLAAKLAAAQRVADLDALADQFEVWRKAWTTTDTEVRLDGLDRSLDQLKLIENRIAELARGAEQYRHAVGKLVDDLLEDSKQMLLLPFGTISASFPKLVRDLCRDQGKEADFEVLGEDVEVDRRLLEHMKDPLVHLLRNSIDHGVETPDERERHGKARRATVRLTVSQVDGNKVQIVLSDDGAGIDAQRVRESAVRRGAITAAEAEGLSDTESQALIYRSDVSTSRIITQLSGRGLGLAIVREKAEHVGGETSVESRPGAGTTFRVVLPSTRATFRGIFVRAAGRLFVVPTASVERVLRARPDDVRTVEGRETIAFDGRAVALVRLVDVLELPPANRDVEPTGGRPAIVLGTGDQRVAFAVDAVVNEQEVLVKPLRTPLSRVRNVAAVTVLVSGGVAPVLHVSDLLKSARAVAGARAESPADAVPATMVARTVLVVEDSITSRMLLKAILESAGYTVKTSVDGLEAFGLLRTEHVDLVVSDVEMPRLNGFDLAARIRADAKLANLPVVLVTARETREDRERGIDAGANAYISKSSFDQSHLLEAVGRLI